jgi:hypothetical protein
VIVGVTIRGSPDQDNGCMRFARSGVRTGLSGFLSTNFKPPQILLLPYPK